MNLKLLLPIACVGAFATGWIAGSTMGGSHAPSASDTSGGKGPPAMASPSSRGASADDEKRAEQTLLGALRDPNYLRRTRDLYDAILKMSPGEISSAIALAQRLPHHDRDTLLPLLVGRWAETDPRAALQFAFSLEPGARLPKVLAATETWAGADTKAAKEWALALPPGENRSSALYGVIVGIAKNDPGSALQLLKSQPADRFTDVIYGRVFSAWAAQSPATAASQAIALPVGRNRDRMIGAVINGWSEADPAAALAWAAQIPEPGVRREALGQAYARWGAHDPKAATAAVLALPAGEDRDGALGNIVNAIHISDPPTAAMLVAQMPAGTARDSSIANVARSWASSDVNAALAWVAQLPEEPSKKTAQRSLVFQWMNSDPRSAADYLLKNAALAGQDGDDTLRTVAAEWAREDPSPALAWVRQIGDEQVRGNVLGGVISSIASRDPRQAASLLAELPPASRPATTDNLVRAWAQNDTDGAAAWVMQLPEGDAKSRAIGNIVVKKSQQDLVKTARWLEQLPVGSSRDAAVREYTSRAFSTDPEGAASWAATISDTKMRNTELDLIAQKWLRQDKAAAAQWITRSTALDAAMKERLLRGN